MKDSLSRIILGYRRQPTKIKALFWLIILTLAIFLVPSFLRQKQVINHPARLYFSEPQAGLTPGLIFPVEVRIQTTGSSINAVSAYLNYSPANLEVVNMTTENSFCTFYLDNSFDNIRGKVAVSCGVPNPGFVGDSLVVRINMRAKTVGSTEVTIDPTSQILANDGKGTDILKDPTNLTLNIQQLL